MTSVNSNNYIIFHHLGYLDHENLSDYNKGIDKVSTICKIDLPMTPSTVTDTHSATFNSQPILGRSAPVYSYTSSGPRTLQISMKLHREMMDDMDYSSYSTQQANYKSLSAIKKSRGSLETLIECMQLAVVPTYTNSAMIIPPKVTLRVENLKITGVVKSVSSVWELPIIDQKYMVATISFSIDELDPYDTSSILKLGGYRGL